MNTTMISRIAWKEYRQQIVFFAVMIVLAIAVQLLFATVYFDSISPSIYFFYLFGVAGGFAALYAVACGATLYATEKEMGTFQNLQLLPMTSKHLLAGKVSIAILLCSVFLVIATVIGVVTSNVMEVEILVMADHAATQLSWIGAMAIIALAVLELFAWGWFYSLLTQRPLVAAVLGILTASVVIAILVQFSHGHIYDAFSIAPYASIWPARLFVAAMMVAVDFSLSLGWLDGTEKRLRIGKNDGTVPATRSKRHETRVRTAPLFLKLTWQTVRTSRRLMFAFVACVGLSVLIFFSGFPLFGIMAAVLSCGVAGVFAFLPDQNKSSYRFLANVGERPTLIWLSRITPWLCVVLGVNWIGWAIAFAFMATTEAASFYHPLPAFQQLMAGNGEWQVVGNGMWTMFLFAVSSGVVACVTFSAGALCSILFRSSVIAGVFGAGVALLACGWCVYTYAAATPWWTNVGLLAVFLLAGWQAMAPWLSQRTAIRRLAVPIALVAVAWISLSSATAWYRANEIPRVTTPHPINNPDLGHLDEIRAAYAAAMANYDPTKKGPRRDLRSQHRNFRYLGDGNVGENERSTYQRDVEEYLETNSESFEKMIAAIEIGQTHLSDLEATQPYFVSSDLVGNDAPAIDYFAKRGIVDALSFLAELEIADGKIDDSWRLLVAQLNFLHQYSFVYPEEAHEGFIEVLDLVGQWALLDGQTEESLLEASYFLYDQDWLLKTNQRRLVAQTNRLHELIDRGEIHDDRRMVGWNKFVRDLNHRAVQWLPWENERAHRFVDLAGSLMSKRISNREVALFNGHYERFRSPLESETQDKLFLTWPVTTLWPEQNAQSSESFFAEWTTRPPSPEYPYAQYYARIQAEQLRRMTMLKLVLLAWHQEHGEYPQSLQVLHHGYGGWSNNWNDEVEIQRYAAIAMVAPGPAREGFGYVREGLPHLSVGAGVKGSRIPSMIAPSTPFICNVPIPTETTLNSWNHREDILSPRAYDFSQTKQPGSQTFVLPLK